MASWMRALATEPGGVCELARGGDDGGVACAKENSGRRTQVKAGTEHFIL